jgi:transposase
VQRRRRWSAEERARSVQETYAPGWRGGTVSQHVVHLTTAICRRRAVHCGAGEEVVPASEYRALHYYVRELQRRKKTLENEILRKRSDLAPPKKSGCCGPPRSRRTSRREGKLRCARLGALQSGNASHTAKGTQQRRGRRPQPEAELSTEIKVLIAGQPTAASTRCSGIIAANNMARQ